MPISPIQAQYLERDQKKKTAQYYQPNTKDKELIDYVSNQFTASEDSKKGRVRDAWTVPANSKNSRSSFESPPAPRSMR